MNSPLVALFKRDLFVSLRSAKLFAFLAAAVGGAILIAADLWPRTPTYDHSLSELAFALEILIKVCLLLGGSLLTAAFASSSLTVEKEEDTYEQLRMTLLSPGAVVAAKIGSATAIYVVLFFAFLPALGLISTLPGIDWQRLFLRFGLILAIVAAVAALGVLSSAWRQRTQDSVVVGYLLALVPLGAPMGLVVLGSVALAELGLIDPIGSRQGPMDAGTQWIIGMTFPLMPLFAENDEFQDLAFVFAIGSQAVLTLGAFLGAAALTRRETARAEGWSLAVAEVAGGRRSLRARLVGWFTRDAGPKAPIADWMDPVAARDFFWGLWRRPPLAGLVLGLTLGLLLLIALISGLGLYRDDPGTFKLEWVLLVTLYCGGGPLILLAPLFQATAITREREGQTLDLLRSTLVSPVRIAAGKFIAGAASFLPLVAAVYLALAAAALATVPFGFEGLIIFSTAGISLAVFLLLALAIGFFASSVAQKTAWSIGLAYLVSVFVFLGFMILLLVLDDAGDWGFSDRFILSFSPIISYLDHLDRTCANPSLGRVQAGECLELINLYWLSSLAGYFFLALGFFGFGAWRYHLSDREDR